MSRHRAFAIFLSLVVVVLVGVTLVLSAVTYFRGRSDANVKLLTPAQQFASVNGNTIVMGFDPDSLSIAENKLTGTLSFLLPETVRSTLIDTNTNKPIYTGCDQSGGCTLSTDQNATFTLFATVHDAAGRPTADITKTFKLSDFGANTDAVFLPVTIPITGFPNNYPDDTYKLGLFYGWQWPSNVYTKNNKEPNEEYEVTGGNVSQNYDVNVAHNTQIKSEADRSFLVTIKRSQTLSIYIYVAALIPLILALIFLHLLFFSRHAESRRVEEYMEALIVTVVAVLPLRLVLVPSELTGLTRVDLVLGLGLVAIVAIAGIKYALEVWQGSSGPVREAEHHEGALPHAAEPVPVAE